MENITLTKSVKKYFESDLGQNPSVNLATGRLRYSFADATVGHGNLTVGISHVYISDLEAPFIDKYKTFGNKWKLNLSQCVMKENDSYVYLDENGEVHRFVKFDNNRYHDRYNAKVVLTVNTRNIVITDGVGNQLIFNNNGLLIESVSCHNSSINKIYKYDESNRLISVYDYRTYRNDPKGPKSHIDLEYDDSDRLSCITAYSGYSTVLAKLIYTYDDSGNLTNVEKAMLRPSLQTKQMFEFFYADGFLTEVKDCETAAVMKFEYDDGRISKQAFGEYIALRRTFKSIKYNTFTYDMSYNDGVSVETDVANEKGITIAYFIDRNASVTSSFEKTSDGKLKTLTKQGAKRTGTLDGSVEYINGHGSTLTNNGAVTVTLPNGFDVARNENEKEIETFEYAVWLKYGNTAKYPRMRLEAVFKFKDNTQYSDYAYVPGESKNVWQRFSIPVYIPKGKTTQLTSVSLQLKFIYSSVSSPVYINEIGFSPASHSILRIPKSGNEYMNYKDIERVTANDERFIQNNDVDGGRYMTEEDIMATYANRYGAWYMLNGHKCFDVIYANNTCRKAGVHTFIFYNKAGALAYGVNGVPYQTYTQISSTDNTVTTDYVHGDSAITIRQTCKFKNAADEVKTSEATSVIDYKGKTLSETDEYGVTKAYDYDDYGNVKSVIVKDASGAVGSAVYYNYDSDGCLLNSHDGVAGQQVSYDVYGNVSDVTEGTVSNGTFSSTQHRLSNTYDTFKEKITNVAEYNGTEKTANNAITYENGQVRTITDGTVKYGVKHSIANKSVEYTEFVGETEQTLQKDVISGNLHTSEFADGEKIVTNVDNYGRIKSIAPTSGTFSEYSYDAIDESNFASKPSKLTYGSDTTEYSYDYDGELTGFTEKTSNAETFAVKQIAPDVTKYDYPCTTYTVSLERDSDKILNPRVNTIKYEEHSPYSADPYLWFRIIYSRDALGRVTAKKTQNMYMKTADTEYTYQTTGGQSRITKMRYEGVGTEGREPSPYCRTYYTVDYSYGSKGEITGVTDTLAWSRRADRRPEVSLSGNRSYQYDALNRLVKETQNGKAITYSYRTDGRLASVNGVNRYYDPQGRLSAISGRSFQYDAYGNRISEQSGGTTKTYKYVHNLLTEANGAKYSYNSAGIRSKKVYNGVTTEYLLDGAKIVGEAQSGSGVIGNNLKDNKKHIDYIYDNEGIQFIKDGEMTYELIKDAFNNVVAVVSLEGAKVACVYRYDAYGNCTVLDENGNVDTNKASVGNTNPFRWKSFYYDTESGLYYANGSYYDPTTGTYLDASPIASIFDNIPQLTNLDRNAPMCNNILELASNPSTAATQTELAPDMEFDIFKDSAWFVKVHIWLRQTMYKLAKWWYKDVHWGIKLGVGIALTLISMGLAFKVGGMLDALAIFGFVALGTLTGVAGYALSGIFGNRLSLEGLGNAALDSFLASSVIAFVITSISYIKYASRARPELIDGVEIQHAQKADFTSEAWERIQSLKHRADGSTISSLSDGRFIHNGFKTSYIGCGKEQKIPSIGRADCIVGNTIYELKPNNSWSIMKGIAQLHRYNAGMGGGYRLVLVLY